MSRSTILQFVLFSTIVLSILAVPDLHGQVDKDRKTLDSLERDVRRDLDKLVSKYRPPSGKKAAGKPESAVTWPISKTTSTYDKFKDVTTIQIVVPLYHDLTEPKLSSGGSLRGFIANIDIIATYSYSGQTPRTPEFITLVFKTFSSGSLFGIDPSFIVLADGKRLNLGNMKQTIRRFERSAEEYESINVPIENFLQIVNADVVEAQIGNLDFPMRDLQLNSLRALIGLTSRVFFQPQALKVNDTASNKELGGSVWEGSKFSLKLHRDGTATLSLPRERPGTWSQRGDKVEMEFPHLDLGAVRGLAVGIVKDDKLVVKMRFSSWMVANNIVEIFKRTE